MLIIWIPLAFHVLMRVIQSILLTAECEHDQTYLSNLARCGDDSTVQTRARAPAYVSLHPRSHSIFSHLVQMDRDKMFGMMAECWKSFPKNQDFLKIKVTHWPEATNCNWLKPSGKYISSIQFLHVKIRQRREEKAPFCLYLEQNLCLTYASQSVWLISPSIPF